MDGHVENSINLTTILIAEKSIQHVKEELETTPISKLNAVFAIIQNGGIRMTQHIHIFRLYNTDDHTKTPIRTFYLTSELAEEKLMQNMRYAAIHYLLTYHRLDSMSYEEFAFVMTDRLTSQFGFTIQHTPYTGSQPIIYHDVTKSHIIAYPDMPEIQKMVCLSTAHLTDETKELLDTIADNIDSNGQCEALVCYEKQEYGWFLPVLSENEQPRQTFPDDLKACFRYAEACHTSWIMFDAECEPMGGLPTYDINEES